MMRKGGNSKLREWFSERGVPNNMRISAKYHTPDAEYYGKRLKAAVEGKEVPAMPPRMPIDTSVDYSKGDPKGKEKLRGESDEAYVARQRALNAEAKARMAAKFGGASAMGGVGSDPSYRPGGDDGGGLGVGAALGSLWGNLAATTQSVAAKAQEELARRELGRKVKEGWEATAATLGDDKKRRDAGAAAKGAVAGLWGSLAAKVADLASPDDDAPFPTFYNPAAKAAAPSTGMAGIGGGGPTAAGGSSSGRGGGGSSGGSAGGDDWDDWGEGRKLSARAAPSRSGSSGALSGSGGDGEGSLAALASGGGGGPNGECPGLPGEDRDGIAGLSGESEGQYAARQARIRDEAKERMRLKFGGGSALGGVGPSSSSHSSQSSSAASWASPSPPRRSPSPPAAFAGLRLSASPPPVAASPAKAEAKAEAVATVPGSSPLARAGSSSGSSSGSLSAKKAAAEVDFFNDFGM
jgi:hypothetical protein